MTPAAERQQYELAAKYRDLISTVELLDKKQRIAAVEGDDADVFGYHYENEMLAVNLFHMRGGKIVDKREFFWEDLSEWSAAAGFEPGEFFSALLKQVYLDQQYVPHTIYVPVDFEDRVDAGGGAVGRAEAAGADSRAAARRQALADRSGGTERQAVVRSALPRDEAGGEGDPGSVAGRAHAAGAAEAHRVLRHLAHSGRGDRGVDGGVGRRQDEEVRLPQVHHPRGRGRGRLRLDARGGDAPLQATCRKRSRPCRAWC